MGKATRWLRSFLTGRRDRKGKDRADSQLTTLASTPSAKEKRRWSFRRPAAAGASTPGQGQLTSTSSHCFSDVHVVVEDQPAVATSTPEVAITAPTTAVAAAPAASERRHSAGDAAAIRIQSSFRSYLARKALCALRGMVKLQAMVRGQLVRRQAGMTLRRMQALVAAQRRARAERMRLLEDDHDDRQLVTRSPRPPTSRRSSPQHHRSRKPLEVVENGSEENVRIVEMDSGGGGGAPHGTPRAYGRRRSYCATPLSRAPAKAETTVHQKVSPTPTDASDRTFSGRFEDYSFSAASEQVSGGHHREPASGGVGGGSACHAGADRAAALPLCYFPSYMANTESSRAKARSHSAPKQRPDTVPGAASPSPSPSPSGGGARGRRASLDPRDLAADARMERCASQAQARASASAAACPWAARMDRASGASHHGSECGSSSTVVTSGLGHRGGALDELKLTR